MRKRTPRSSFYCCNERRRGCKEGRRTAKNKLPNMDYKSSRNEKRNWISFEGIIYTTTFFFRRGRGGFFFPSDPPPMIFVHWEKTLICGFHGKKQSFPSDPPPKKKNVVLCHLSPSLFLLFFSLECFVK